MLERFTWGIETSCKRHLSFGSCWEQESRRLRNRTDCTPYLLQLGLTKSYTSAVWIAAPLSGLIMQPVIGVLADSSRSKWGRRRPFMIGGALIVGFCLLVLGWTAEIVGFFIKEPDLVSDGVVWVVGIQTLTAVLPEKVMYHRVGSY